MIGAVTKTIISGLVAIGAVFLLAITAMGVVSYRLSEAGYWSAHTHQVIEELLYSLEKGFEAVGELSFADRIAKSNFDYNICKSETSNRDAYRNLFYRSSGHVYTRHYCLCRARIG